MQQHERTEHRRAIAGIVEVILHGYWQPDDSEAMRAGVLRDWCDSLENWPVKSVLAAMRKWREENPNKRPNPGHILGMLKESWGKRHADQVRAAIASPVECPKERVSPEAAKAIMAEVGMCNSLAVKTIAGITPTGD